MTFKDDMAYHTRSSANLEHSIIGEAVVGERCVEGSLA